MATILLSLMALGLSLELDTRSLEKAIFEQANQARLAEGRPALRADRGLAKIARRHSRDMFERDFLSHLDPDGRSPQDRNAFEHRRFVGLTAENLYVGWGDLDAPIREVAERVVSTWLDSPRHRENLLDPGFTHAGIGAVSQDGELRVTQNLMAVRARLRTALPRQVPEGKRVDLFAQGHPKSAASPVRCDLISVETGEVALEPVRPMKIRLMVRPGDYQVRYYFPKLGNIFEIAPGPVITVIKD